MINDFYKHFEQQIEKHGFTMIGSVDEDNRSFAYTIGLCLQKRPELIIVGLRADYAAPIITALVNIIGAHSDVIPQPGDLYSVAEDIYGNDAMCGIGLVGDWAFDEYLCQSKFFAEYKGIEKIEARQLLAPDRSGVMPYELHYDHAYMQHRQPCLDESRTFKKH